MKKRGAFTRAGPEGLVSKNSAVAHAGMKAAKQVGEVADSGPVGLQEASDRAAMGYRPSRSGPPENLH